MSGPVLTINAGSSSIKFALFDTPCDLRIRGEVERVQEEPQFRVLDRSGHVVIRQVWQAGIYESLLERLLSWAESYVGNMELGAAGHRIVHGGQQFARPVVLNTKVLDELAKLEPLAPLHQVHNLNAVRAVAQLRPHLLQVGCFDTGFHSTISATARRFGLPRAMEAAGIRRYGFHGLSYEYIASRLKEIDPAAARGRIIVAHLGSGASLCAMRDGVSIDTSMGFSPLDGLVMGTRCGALDPGVILYLMQTQGLDCHALEDLLYRRSGLLGVSGISEDMRTLLASEEASARNAVDLFVFRAARETAALAASLGGLDGLVFTGGIGENSAEIRERIVAQLEWLGARVNSIANWGGALRIGQPDSRVKVWRIPTDEETIIAARTFALVPASVG
jgi:acetate kinase